MRSIINSEHRVHSAALFSKLGILDIFECMYCYHNNLFAPSVKLRAISPEQLEIVIAEVI